MMLDGIDVGGARDLRSALKEIVSGILRSDPDFCSTWRVYRAKVTTAPNGATCGVLIVGQTQSISLPYSSSVSGAAVGDLVLVGTIGGALSNGVVWNYADFR